MTSNSLNDLSYLILLVSICSCGLKGGGSSSKNGKAIGCTSTSPKVGVYQVLRGTYIGNTSGTTDGPNGAGTIALKCDETVVDDFVVKTGSGQTLFQGAPADTGNWKELSNSRVLTDVGTAAEAEWSISLKNSAGQETWQTHSEAYCKPELGDDSCTIDLVVKKSVSQ